MSFLQCEQQLKVVKVIFPQLLLMGVFTLFFLIVTPSTQAHELSPVDNIKPSQSEPAIGNLPENTGLNEEDKLMGKDVYKNNQIQPSWWNWLTNSSSKPAYFHYVDILELLG